ncbi:MAG: putative sugar O-methyltransferase [Burkholderiaceae bacterium]|nr:putative sugar O-methyltransferase [Burkholderiaceae bacterium]
MAGYRAIHALWQAWRIQSQLSDPPSSHALEIGAGLGRTAYYAKKFNIGSYAIVDIPFTAISSAHFLMTMFGPHEMHLFGEPKNNASIQIMPPQAFFESHERFDLIVNFDSFTEIDRTMASLYWKHIFKLSEIFLSINHEVNPFRVADFYTGHDKQYKVERFPCWLRKGYVEELVRLHK